MNRYVTYTLSKRFWTDVTRILWFVTALPFMGLLTFIGFVPGLIFWPIYESFIGARAAWKDWGDSISKLGGPR